MAEITIRRARPEDAGALARMAEALNVAMGEPEGRFTAELLLRDLFAPGAVIEALVAEQEQSAVGYAFFHDAYNTDLPARGIWVVDLYVEPEARRAGVGQRLMATLARETRRRGGRSLALGVLEWNRGARAFYARLGAKDAEARILELVDEPLVALAAEPPFDDSEAD